MGFPQISETIYTPALPSVAIGLATSAHLVEATLSIYFIGFALGVLIWGTISDVIGRRPTMLIGLIAYSLGTLGCGHADHVETLLGYRFLQAFGASVGSVITQAILRDVYEGKERTKLFAVMSGALAFSPAIGPLLGGYLSELGGWRANFWILGALSAVLIIWIFRTLPETRPPHLKRTSVESFYALVIAMGRSSMLWGHALLIGSTNSILFGFYQEAPFVFIDQLGLKPSSYGFFGILIATATLLAARFSYRQVSYRTPEVLIQWGAGCCLFGSLVLSLTVVIGAFSLNPINQMFVIFLLFTIFFGVGLIIPNSLSCALKPFQHAAGTAGSIFGGIYYLFIAASTGLMSYFHNQTALPLTLYMSVLSLILAGASQITAFSFNRDNSPLCEQLNDVRG